MITPEQAVELAHRLEAPPGTPRWKRATNDFLLLSKTDRAAVNFASGRLRQARKDAERQAAFIQQ